SWGLVVGAIALLVGCAPTPVATTTIDDVAAERAVRAEQRVETLLSTYADYLTTRWPGIVLPPTSIDSWLGLGEWPGVFESCASDYSGLSVRVNAASGVFADPSPQTAWQMRDFELSIYLCQGQFPPPNLARNDPGPVEIEWVTAYARTELPSCLRRHGVIAPPLGTEPFAILSGGSTPRWDPYVSSRGDAAELRRLQALCPHPATVLSTLSAVGEPR
ncbi:MAG: hypothetical protein Q7J04_09810, partial [Microcella sp.]|nr:hypothetical protein [Microcella sp.]